MKIDITSFILFVLLHIALISTSFAQLSPGDIAFIGYQSDEPKQFAFIVLTDIPLNTEILFTDNGWTAADTFRTREGIIQYTTPALNIGDIVTVQYSSSTNYTVYGGGTLEHIDGDFNLSASGDQIFAYQVNAQDTSFITGLNYARGTWYDDAADSKTSALPNSLIEGNTAISLTHKDNGIYVGLLTGTKAELLPVIYNSDNWFKQDSPGFSMLANDFPYNVWDATTGEWDTSENWLTRNIPGANVHVYIPETNTLEIGTSTQADCNKITIESEATLTIKANATGTGSLICNSAAGDGTTNIECYIPSDDWHIVTSPVAGQSMLKFAQNNGLDSYDDGTKTDYDLAPYNESQDEWSPYLLSDGSNGDVFIPGKGYAIRRTIAAGAGTVTFSGTMVAGNQNVELTRNLNGWNAVGNSYSSAIKATGTGSFQSVNSDQLDTAYSGLYVWNHTLSDYDVYSASNTKAILPGQGFIIRSKTGGGNVTFTPDMQQHLSGEVLKSDELPWPAIKLVVQNSNQINSTTITFNSKMTNGLDPLYDVGKLKGNPEFALYTRLPKDDGIDFAIQALPEFTSPTLRIPVGFDFENGGEVTFTCKLTNFPEESPVYLEDAKEQTFTLLNQENAMYSTFIDAGQKGTGRFFLVTTESNQTAIQETERELLSISTQFKQIYIDGPVGSKTFFELYGIDGKLWHKSMAKNQNQNRIDGSTLPDGIYLLKIEQNNRSQTKKLILTNTNFIR